MNVTYVFSSLESLADHFENQAKKHDQTKTRTRREQQSEKGAAYAWRSAAAIVRATKLESVPDAGPVLGE